MKEFLLKCDVPDIMKLAGKPKTEKCYVVVNAGNTETPDKYGGMRRAIQKSLKSEKKEVAK
jgi:hypothetical protein